MACCLAPWIRQTRKPCWCPVGDPVNLKCELFGVHKHGLSLTTTLVDTQLFASTVLVLPGNVVRHLNCSDDIRSPFMEPYGPSVGTAV